MYCLSIPFFKFCRPGPRQIPTQLQGYSISSAQTDSDFDCLFQILEERNALQEQLQAETELYAEAEEMMAHKHKRPFTLIITPFASVPLVCHACFWIVEGKRNTRRKPAWAWREYANSTLGRSEPEFTALWGGRANQLASGRYIFFSLYINHKKNWVWMNTVQHNLWTQIHIAFCLASNFSWYPR